MAAREETGKFFSSVEKTREEKFHITNHITFFLLCKIKWYIER